MPEAAKTEGIESLREQIEKTTPRTIETAAEPEETLTRDPKDSKVWTFQFKYEDSRGKTWEGAFTNKILTVRDRMNSGLLKAKLLGGAPIQSVDAYTDNLLEFVAHMTYSLIKRPDWAKNLDQLLENEDADLVAAVYAEVQAHEAYYFRRNEVESPSESDGSDSGESD